MRFTERLRALIAARASGRNGIFAYNGKIEGRMLAEQLGVRVPRLVSGPFDLEQWPSDPLESVTIKPTGASTARGVFPLMFDGAGYLPMWPEVLTSHDSFPWAYWRERSWQEWQRYFGTPSGYDGQWMLEELVEAPVGGVEFDWKCYVIHGRVGYVRQHQKIGRRAHDCRVRCWTREWEPIPGDVLIQSKRADDTLSAPRHGPAIIDAAERIALELKKRTGTPFVRVDLYEDDDGPLFGEITPHPSGGQQVYRDEWDVRLGRMWEAGAA